MGGGLPVSNNPNSLDVTIRVERGLSRRRPTLVCDQALTLPGIGRLGQLQSYHVRLFPRAVAAPEADVRVV
jgi:hypothetical protein